MGKIVMGTSFRENKISTKKRHRLKTEGKGSRGGVADEL